MMDILAYNELDTGAVQEQYDRTVAMLARGDFRAADVRKMRGTPYYRAKLNDADRLLFRFGTFEGKTYLLLLEVIYRHAYDQSRFLNGAAVDEGKLEPVAAPDGAVPEAESLRYVNPRSRNVHFLGKILSFDDDQADVLGLKPPLIVIGSAGSGKTVLTLEKMKPLNGELLYVTHSPYLTECSRALYYSGGYDNPKQEVDFLSFSELLAAAGIPGGKPLDFRAFNEWFRRHRADSRIKDAHMLHEEFSGVLTGCPVHAAYLSRTDYLELGIRRSIFPREQRDAVYDLFEKYLRFLEEKNFYNINMAVFERLATCPQRYDFVVVDEVQDITNVQLLFVLRHLRKPGNFLLSGDSNQIVHPNFFSWSALKAMFYEQEAKKSGKRTEIMRILRSNYRNSRAVTDFANKILLAKTSRFGSVDRESNYLVRCVADTDGTVELLKATPAACRDFNRKTGRSTQYAIVVLREEEKTAAAQHFDTPLIFSVREAKGLEYENIILFNMITSAGKEFHEIAKGVDGADLEHDDMTYARAKDKSDKSLEIFKFFINALYVAVTRAVSNVYSFEERPNHVLYRLLGLAQARKHLELKESVSTEREWQSEAGRLEQQGKAEQAAAIRERILRQKPVPWRVVTTQELPRLEDEALNPEHFNKKAKQLLFDYAMVHRRMDYMPKLAELNFKPAVSPGDHVDNVERRYTQAYKQPRLSDLRQLLKRHGVDFRDPLNRTPLMMAASLGMYDLAQELLADGAAASAVDNHGRTPFMQGLATIAAFSNAPPGRLASLFRCVPPQPLTLRAANTQFKIDPHHGLFPIFYAFIAQRCDLAQHAAPRPYWQQLDIGLRSADVARFLAQFPNHLVPAYRKRRAYVSALLARHEYARPDYRRLFLRTEHGQYLLNPELQIQLGDNWVWINDFSQIHEQVNHQVGTSAEEFRARALLTCLDAIQAGTFERDEYHSQAGVTASCMYRQIIKTNTEEHTQQLVKDQELWLKQFHSRSGR